MVAAGARQVVCQYCGATYLLDDEAQHLVFSNAEQAGYEFEKGRLRAQREQAAPRVAPAQVRVTPQAPSKPKRRTWLWVLGWIFCFPIPLTVILLTNTTVKRTLKPSVRYALVLILWLLVLMAGRSN